MATQTSAIGHAAAPPGAIARPDFEIVPVRFIPFVAIALVGLVGAIMSNELWALEFFHVAGGGMWTGIDLFVGLIIGPILARLPIEARIQFLIRFMPKMVLVMPLLVIMTLASGWRLAHYTGDLFVAYPEHWWLTASFIVVGVMSVIAVGILTPANLAVLFELKKKRPNGELIGKLTRRFVYTALVTGIMQLATLVIMTKIATGV